MAFNPAQQTEAECEAQRRHCATDTTGFDRRLGGHQQIVDGHQWRQQVDTVQKPRSPREGHRIPQDRNPPDDEKNRREPV
jgi:hypothetical protein